MIFIIKVTTNKEERAVDMIADRIEKKNLSVFSVSRPHGLRGYILLEAENRLNMYRENVESGIWTESESQLSELTVAVDKYSGAVEALEREMRTRVQTTEDLTRANEEEAEATRSL